MGCTSSKPSAVAGNTASMPEYKPAELNRAASAQQRDAGLDAAGAAQTKQQDVVSVSLSDTDTSERDSVCGSSAVEEKKTDSGRSRGWSFKQDNDDGTAGHRSPLQALIEWGSTRFMHGETEAADEKNKSKHKRRKTRSTAELRGEMENTSVIVVVRVRPLNSREKSLKSGQCIDLQPDDSLTATESSGQARAFAFDAVFNPQTSQEEVYERTGALVLEKALQGYNVTMFAYGQTGSGKTYTMEGSAEDPGVIQRVCEDLFRKIVERSEQVTTTVTVSYIEIYLEKIRDLLVASHPRHGHPQQKVYIRQHSTKGIYLENATMRTVGNVEEILDLMAEGTERRQKAETQMNEVSSRSHAVLTLSMEHIDVGDTSGITRKTSKLHLIDLAGSERANDTGATGTRLKEASKINQSLSALGNVISALTDEKKSKTHIPYRDSKLTRLLTDSLGGNAFTVVCCNISPASVCYGETIGTLRFAERAKKVQNKVAINRNPLAEKIQTLQLQNSLLEGRVDALERLLKQHGIAIPPSEL